MSKRKIRVMIDMSATLIHHGHVNLINMARQHFEGISAYIIIGLTTDKEVLSSKGYLPELTYAERKVVLEGLKYVDEVVPTPWIITEEIMNIYDIDYLFHGSDNSNNVSNVIVYPRTSGISSEEIRKRAVKSIVEKRNYDKPMFTPGPSNMSYLNMYDIKGSFGRGDDEYTDIEQHVLNNIIKLTGHDEIVRLQGGGTTAIDIATSNIVLGKVLIVDAGYYSKRIATIYSKKSKSIPETTWKTIRYNEIEEEMEKKESYDWVATSYVETADAFLCDINLLKMLADKKGAKLFLDATASINLEDHHQLSDACSFSSCKGLGGLTGASFITFKNGIYNRKLRGDLPFTMELETHINKLYTGPYHSICSLWSVSNHFDLISENVKKSKAIFLKKYSGKILRHQKYQPAISTIINAKFVDAGSGVLYQPRTSPPDTAVICHLGDMFSQEGGIGEIYERLRVE